MDEQHGKVAVYLYFKEENSSLFVVNLELKVSATEYTMLIRGFPVTVCSD